MSIGLPESMMKRLSLGYESTVLMACVKFSDVRPVRLPAVDVGKALMREVKHRGKSAL